MSSSRTIDIPTLETARLRLRAHRADDFAQCTTMWADPKITRYTIGAPSSQQRTWIRILAYLGHWSLLGFGYWAVEEKSSGHSIGEMGFADFKRNAHPELNDRPELGWVISTPAQGKGYATEALQAVLSWGDTNLNHKSTYCLIHPDNLASLKVAQKLGFKEFARIIKEDHPEILLTRAREVD